MTEETRQVIEAEKARDESLDAPSILQTPAPIVIPESAVDLLKNPVSAVKVSVAERARDLIKNDTDVSAKVDAASKKVVDSGLSTATAEAERLDKEAYKNANQDACDLYGIDETSVPKWVVKNARRVQNFWYAVWLFVGFFTTAPIVFLSKKIKVVCKKSWLAVILAIAIYLAVTLAPIIYTIIKKSL